MIIGSIIFMLCAGDSLGAKAHSIKLSPAWSCASELSASYINYKNWKYGYNSFAFRARESISYDSTGKSFERHYRFTGELGYTKLTDSVWLKNSDYLDISLEAVKTKGRRINNVFSMFLNTQFLSSYDLIPAANNTTTREWTGGFCNPLTLDLGYGSSIRFWKTCRINLNYVGLRTSVSPLTDPQQALKDNDMTWKKSLIRSEYGFTAQTMIRHGFGDRFRWENHSRLFINAINRNRLDADLRNRLILKIIRHLDLILDSRMRYTPAPPYQLQFRNELMLSFNLERP